jgi:hypothetical protein
MEGPGEVGAKTPWRQLKEWCKQNSVNVTGMFLVRNNIRVTSLPAKQCDGYFQAYEVHESVNSHAQFRLQGIGSVVGDKIFITWIVISDNPTNADVFQEVRKLDADSVIHTTLE